MRAMNEAPAGASVDEEIQNVLYYPTGYATTGFSGGCSLGLPYKGVWCSPPRVFGDNQDGVIPHIDRRMVPSTIDPDAAGLAEKDIKALKRAVNRNAWKLENLDASEATRAAARARASSYVLRTIDNRHLPDHEFSSSGAVSIITSVSTNANVGACKEMLNNDLILSLSINSFAPRQRSRDEYETGSHCLSNFSSPSRAHESVTLAPLPQNPTVVGHHMFDPLFLSAPATCFPRDVRRTSIVWDPEAGRYVSAHATTFPEVHNRLPNPPQDSCSGSSAERRLTYTGDSIFFGKTLIRDNLRIERSSVRKGQDILASTLHPDARFKRDSTSNQLPVFTHKSNTISSTQRLPSS